MLGVRRMDRIGQLFFACCTYNTFDVLSPSTLGSAWSPSRRNPVPALRSAACFESFDFARRTDLSVALAILRRLAELPCLLP